MSDDPAVGLERDGPMATLTLRRPAQRNAVTPELIEALHAHAETLHQVGDLGVVVLQAEGPMFCVGADVKRMAERCDDLVGYVDSLIRPAHAALLSLATLPVPLVCLLRGTAAGGGVSLALACDVVVASRSARLVFAYPRLGTTPDMGLSHALIERVGQQRALQLFLLSDGIAMDEALKLGLVQHVADDAEIVDDAMRIARRLMQEPASAAKQLFLHDRSALLAARLEREREWFLRCSGTPTFRDRVKKFAEGGRG